MPLSDLITAIHALWQPLGLTCLPYEPSAIAPPTLYTTVERVDYARTGLAHITTVLMRHRLCLTWQSQLQAEAALLTWLAAISASWGTGPSLPAAHATLTHAQTGFVALGAVKYRVIDWYSETGLSGRLAGTCGT